MEFCENYVIIIKRKKEAEASLFNEIEESSLLPSHEDYGRAGDDDRNDHDSEHGHHGEVGLALGLLVHGAVVALYRLDLSGRLVRGTSSFLNSMPYAASISRSGMSHPMSDMVTEAKTSMSSDEYMYSTSSPS